MKKNDRFIDILKKIRFNIASIVETLKKLKGNMDIDQNAMLNSGVE